MEHLPARGMYPAVVEEYGSYYRTIAITLDCIEIAGESISRKQRILVQEQQIGLLKLSRHTPPGIIGPADAGIRRIGKVVDVHARVVERPRGMHGDRAIVVDKQVNALIPGRRCPEKGRKGLRLFQPPVIEHKDG
jgi:hypothetical protein